MAAQAEEPISAHIDSPHRSAAHLPEHVAVPIGAQTAAEALEVDRCGTRNRRKDTEADLV